jgi:hypothetical protein
MHPTDPLAILQSTPLQAQILVDLELLESLGRRLVLGHSEDVESDGLGQRSALANGDLVAVLDTESGGAVGGEVLVAFLVSAVFGDAAMSARLLREYHWGGPRIATAIHFSHNVRSDCPDHTLVMYLKHNEQTYK